VIGKWVERGLCRNQGNPLEWWWPESNDDRNAAYALAICQQCPVREPCGQHAISYPEEFGIWGGTLPESRRRARAIERERYAGPGVVGLSLARNTDSPAMVAERRRTLREVVS
jgi:WhiB family redox-sensing transcriptional regulator